MFQHTTASLAKCAGCTPETILAWRDNGFFDGIETSRTSGGKGKGVQILWHTDAMARVKEIVELKAQGYNTERLQAHFRKPKSKSARKATPKKQGPARKAASKARAKVGQPKTRDGGARKTSKRRSQ